MKEYAVSVCYPTYATIYVDAESDEDAIVKAKKIDASGEAPMDFETDFSATPTFAIED
jgi:hypothetical protein